MTWVSDYSISYSRYLQVVDIKSAGPLPFFGWPFCSPSVYRCIPCFIYRMARVERKNHFTSLQFANVFPSTSFVSING